MLYPTKGIRKINGRSTSSKKIAVVSDTHHGSSIGLCSNNLDRPTRWQQALREHWLNTSDLLGKFDFLLDNGDVINGVNKKQLGYENWTSDINEQLDDKILALREMRYSKVLFTRGSGYHVKDGGWTNYEETLARMIGAVKHGEGNYYTDEETAFELGGKVFNACHHVGGSIWFHYSTTPLTREGMGLSLNRTKYYNEEVEHIDVVIRSHRHNRIFIDIGRQLLCQTGGWQFRTEYMKRSGMGGMYPSISAIWFIIEPNGEIVYHKNDMPDKMIPKKQLLHL